MPIGLINGNTHVDGGRPPLDPRRTLSAIRAASTATDTGIVEILGVPSFPTGCEVDIDIGAWAAGSHTEATLTARIDVGPPGRLATSHLPPDCTSGETAEAIQSRMEWSQRHPHETVDHDRAAEREPTPPIRDVSDDSTGNEARIVVYLRPGADTDTARRFVATLWGVHRRIAVHVGVPIADLIRRFSEAHSPIPARTCPAAHSYWSRLLFDTSTLPATHRSTTAATVSRSAPSSPDAANVVAAA